MIVARCRALPAALGEEQACEAAPSAPPRARDAAHAPPPRPEPLPPRSKGGEKRGPRHLGRKTHKPARRTTG